MAAATLAAGKRRDAAAVESAGRRESLRELLGNAQIDPPRLSRWPNLCNAPSPGLGHSGAGRCGFAWVGAGIDLVTETELFATSPSVRRRKSKRKSAMSCADQRLERAQHRRPCVHSAHGIGRYRGLVSPDVGQKRPQGERAAEFLHLSTPTRPRCMCP